MTQAPPTVPARARHSDHSLAVYLAPIVAGRRVAVVGATSGEVALRLRALGAQTVVAFGGTGEGVAVRALVPGAIAGFAGRLDCIVVPDAASVAPLDAVLEEARKALGQDGVLVVASQPAGGPVPLEGAVASTGPDYYDLHDALSARFASVQMLGRGPFIAYAIAALGEGSAATGISLDTRLMGDENPAAEAYIAIASDRPVALDAISLVQLPTHELLGALARLTAPARPTAPVAEDRAAIEKRDAKVRELENTAAERWVQVQRLEHELKALDEEARKARDRAVRLAKELDDERKARQRTELEAQMVRRAPEPSAEETAKARERLASLERDLAAAQKNVAREAAKRADLERELDETQATEIALRAELDAAQQATAVVEVDDARHAKSAAAELSLRGELERTKGELDQARGLLEARREVVAKRVVDPSEAEYERIERELRARAEELIALRGQVAERDAAVRELAYSLAANEQSDRAVEAQASRERVAELSALHAALSHEAGEIVGQNELLRERVAHLETEVLAKASDAHEAAARVEALESELREAERAGAQASAPPADHAQELERARGEQAEARAGVLEAKRALDEERTRAAALARQLADARNDLARQYAMIASTEDRVSQTQLELDGARAGYTRRVRELEHEVLSLVQALELTGTQSRDEEETLVGRLREIELLKAERRGVQLRLDDAEAAIRERAIVPVPRVEEPARAPLADLDEEDEHAGDGVRSEQLLADLSETASRLANTEEALAAAREAAQMAERRSDEMSRALGQMRDELERAARRPAAPTGPSAAEAEVLESLRRESAERELLARSLVAQLEDRDLRLRAMDRRLVEDVERARRTESEIWEVELRARDQRIASLAREVERARAEGAAVATPAFGAALTAHNGGDRAAAPDVSSLRAELEGRERELNMLRASLEQVRAGLSSILVDGRGAVVAHDLVSILRQIEEEPASDA